MEYILTKSDYEDIRILVAITESIWESYEILANLEIAGKKETSEYQRTMEQLHSTLGMEPTIYGRLGTSFSKLSSIIQYLEGIEDNKLKKDRLETMLKGQKYNLVIERILRNIDGSLFINQEIKQEIKSMISDFDLDEESEEIKQMFKSVDRNARFMNSYMEVESSMEEDKYACFLSILKKMIASPFHKDIRPQLIMMKYRMSFVCKKMEEMMLKQNFEVLPQVYLQTRTVGQLENQHEFITTMILVRMAVSTIRKQTDMLLSNYKNDTLLDMDKKAEAFTRLCMLRAGLLFLPPSCLEQENERFHDNLGSKEYRKTHSNNGEIEKMIMSAYRSYNQDRCIPIQVSFIK